MSTDEQFLRHTLELAYANSRSGGRPFAALVAQDGVAVATGVNDMVATFDPTAHAEMTALRAAGQKLRRLVLDDCVMYASGHPCPMCLAAMRMSGIKRVIYAYSNDDGEPFGLSTTDVYEELRRPLAQQSVKFEYLPLRLENAPNLYADWKQRQA